MSAARATALAASFFEDLTPGKKMRHHRGKTISELENVLITNLVVNTADGHFNEHAMQSQPVGARIVFGAVTASLIIGLASQDASENVIREVSLEKMKLRIPVLHGDTLYAFTEVLAATPLNASEGEVRFHHWGINHRNQIVFEADRTVVVRRRAAPSSEGINSDQ